MQFAGSASDFADVYAWVERNTLGSFDPTEQIAGTKRWPESGVAVDKSNGKMIIATRAGGLWVNLMDWVVRSVSGEFYPCDPSIFESTYDRPFRSPAKKPSKKIHTDQIAIGDTIKMEDAFVSVVNIPVSQDASVVGRKVGYRDRKTDNKGSVLVFGSEGIDVV